MFLPRVAGFIRVILVLQYNIESISIRFGVYGIDCTGQCCVAQNVRRQIREQRHLSVLSSSSSILSCSGIRQTLEEKLSPESAALRCQWRRELQRLGAR